MGKIYCRRLSLAKTIESIYSVLLQVAFTSRFDNIEVGNSGFRRGTYFARFIRTDFIHFL